MVQNTTTNSKLRERVMLLKRKCPANKKAEECTVCCQKVKEKTKLCSACEVKCQKWFHCYCAGVSVAQFQDLSTAPTLCYVLQAVSWGRTWGTESHGDSSDCWSQGTMCSPSTSLKLTAAMFYPVLQLRAMNAGTLLPEERNKISHTPENLNIYSQPLSHTVFHFWFGIFKFSYHLEFLPLLNRLITFCCFKLEGKGEGQYLSDEGPPPFHNTALNKYLLYRFLYDIIYHDIIHLLLMVGYYQEPIKLWMPGIYYTAKHLGYFNQIFRL